MHDPGAWPNRRRTRALGFRQAVDRGGRFAAVIRSAFSSRMVLREYRNPHGRGIRFRLRACRRCCLIITVTLNPAVDQTMFVDFLAPGKVNRVHETQLDPAGKGINASRTNF